MKICVITTVHPPDDVRINKELKSLKKDGHEIIFIAPEGNFNQIGIKYIPIHKYGGRISRAVKGFKEALSKCISVDADIYHFHDPELIRLGLKLKKRGKQVIYDIHEDYPSIIMMKSWIPKMLRPVVSKLFAWYQSRAVKEFDGIISTVKEYLERFNKTNKFAIVPNYPDLAFFESLIVSKKPGKKIKFLYVGSLDEDRAILETIEAFKTLKNKGIKLSLELIGPLYSEKIKREIITVKSKYDDFSFTPRIPYEEAMKKTAQADVGLLIVHKGKSKEESSPLKMFEYMALGKPQIASDFKAWREILDEGPCALYVNPDDPEDIANKMEIFCNNPELIEKLGNNAKKIVKKYSWSSIENRLLKLYRRI